tara:strand:- start:861 stop:2024 length:1164 start_codon:yes stop_codon:yes gene_type:complete
MQLRIRKPFDTMEYYETSLTCSTFDFSGRETIGFNRSAKDPVHSGLVGFWRGILSPRGAGRSWSRNKFSKTFNHVVMINGCPISITREGIRYQINGKAYSLATCCAALARLTYKSCFEDDAATLMMSLYATLSLPENVKYCMENRAPFHFIEDFKRVDVRLNVQQIGDKEMAIEIGDGLWGTMSVRDLDTYCNFYVHGKSRGSWKRLAPETLYEKVLGRKPTVSEVTVMVAFLQQNRTQDLVNNRAIELVNDMLIQHDGKLFAKYDDYGLDSIYVRGKHYDWKLTANAFKSDIQAVSTYVWQPHKTEAIINKGEENEYSETQLLDPEWKGPICIDNMSAGSPVGDQFAARALALLNDSFTITIVNTIRSHLVAEPNEYRADFNEEML